MKKLFITGIALILFFFSFSQEGGWRKNESEIKVYFSDISEFDNLKSLKLNGDFYKDFAILYITPNELSKIKEFNLQYEIQKNNLNIYYSDFWNSDVPAGYYDYQDIIDIADSLATNFPDICQKIIYGTSLGGRQLTALKISDNVTIDENEAEILFDGGIHGDELCASENVIRFARDLCIGFENNDPQITDLINNREIWLYLMVNPDGRANMSRYNINGVDLNRDWGYMWDGWGSSTSEYSQIESKSLRNCSFNNQFVVHTTYHSGTEYMSLPWSYRSSQCPDYAHIYQLAGVYASESGYSNLEYGQGNTGMYAINGSTKDSNYGIQGSISWSMEISYEKQPPANQVLYYYNINKPSMLAMIEYSGYGLEGTITDAVTGDPIQGIVFVNDYFQTYTDPLVGDYHKYVLPGTYSITVMANGYETQTISNIVVTEENSTVTDFQMQALEGQYAYKIWSCRIPENNESDEGYTMAVFGAADNINYSIGKSGTIVLDMQNLVYDGPGNDIKIYEGDTSPETYDCFASETADGPWELIGTGTGTTEFDFAGLISEAQFIKIEDDGDGSQNVDNAGFDLDAVEALEHISGVYLSVTDYYIDDSSTGNNDGILDPGETADLIITVRNNGDINANNIVGDMVSSDPNLILISISDNFGTLAQSELSQGTYTIQAIPETPVGYEAAMTLNLSANSGSYTKSEEINIIIGEIPTFLISNGGSVTTCTGIFYDSGSEASAYQNNENYTITFFPESAGNLIEANFTFFDIEAHSTCNYDALSIYDGTSSSAALIGTYCGSTSPGLITATNNDGALTFEFTSDGSVTHEGWIAEISCYSLNTPSGQLNGGTPNICINSSTGIMTLLNYTETISSWEKSLNNGDWETIENTSNTYFENNSIAGSWKYRVVLNEGAYYSNNIEIEVYENPIAAYTYIANNQTISFTNTSSGAINYSWDFGYGNTSTIENPEYTFPTSGNYNVELIAINGVCADNIYSEEIPVTYIGISQIESTIQIIPNPNNGIFKIDFGNLNINHAFITIYSISGQSIYQTKTSSNNIEIDLANYSNGVYFIKVDIENKSYNKMIVIM